MEEEPLVSDLVLHVLEASSSAISKHFSIAFEATKDFDAIRRKCLSFDGGEMQDLEDSDGIAKGFDHDAISEIFRGFAYRPNSAHGVNRHIWGADDDHHLKSLVRTGVGRKRERSQEAGSTDDEQRRARIHSRTRVSALVQQALLRSRRVVQFEKASTAIKDTDECHVFTPSPFYIAKQILTNPISPATEAYATAALNIEMLRRFRPRFGEINLNHQTIQRALELIWNRAFTSKPIRSSGDARGETLYLCHHLAMKGILSLQVEWKRQSPSHRPDRLFNSINNLFHVRTRSESADRTHPISFRLHPGFADTPDAGELLNELRGLPLPIEGASTIFHQGLRFGSNGEIVAAVSGPAGVGKTSACLSIAAALAPLGCRTLFLSGEEAAEDLTTRLDEAVADSIRMSSPPFRCQSLDDFRIGSGSPSWFQAHSVRVRAQENTPIDAASEIRSFIETTIDESEFFRVFRETDRSKLPYFARPIIVVDGFHQLFLETEDRGAEVERSLRQLIDICRMHRAIFIFTMASNGKHVERLEYLCDLVMEFDRRGIQRPDEFTTRIVKLLKVRRQPALIGAHLFHLTGSKRFRIKPNVAATAEKSKSLRWVEPDPTSRVMLFDGTSPLSVRAKSQILLYGKGSSGKAGLGLAILHRRALSNRQFAPGIEKKDIAYYEARTLVVSFLYQTNYFKTLGKKLPLATSPGARLSVLPNRALIDVISLYPGGLTPEDLLSKVDNRLLAAELSGVPYTGVLIDGIHNVFVQFPILEQDATVWPQLYNLLRRRGKPS